MVIYNWKKIQKKRRAFDDGSLIKITTITSKTKYNYVKIKKRLFRLLNSNRLPKYVEMYYSEEGYLAIKPVDEEDAETYTLREETKNSYVIRSALLDYFEGRKYFEKDIEIDKRNGMFIIKVVLLNKYKTPTTEGVVEILGQKVKK